MASAITTTATTLEGQAFEIFQKLQSLELAIEPGTRPDNASITPNFETQIIALSVQLPISYTTNNTGQMVVSAGTYL